MPLKSEAEIRAHRDAIRICMESPCGCAGTRHEPECWIGLRMMKATLETLSWALGESPELQELVDGINHAATRLDAPRRN